MGSNGNKQDKESHTNDGVSMECSAGNTSNLGCDIHFTEGIEAHNAEMSAEQKVLDKQNWTHLANILDRIFFCVGFFLVVVAAMFLFPASRLP